MVTVDQEANGPSVTIVHPDGGMALQHFAQEIAW